jgi:hypothetical protein
VLQTRELKGRKRILVRELEAQLTPRTELSDYVEVGRSEERAVGQLSYIVKGGRSQLHFH